MIRNHCFDALGAYDEPVLGLRRASRRLFSFLAVARTQQGRPGRRMRDEAFRRLIASTESFGAREALDRFPKAPGA